MATEAQRARRRRQRQRRRSTGYRGGQNATRITGNRPPAQRSTVAPGGRVNTSTWYTETHYFSVDTLKGAPVKGNNIWQVLLNDSGALIASLKTAGEFRLINLRCNYTPLVAGANDRIGIAPYFDPSNKLEDRINFPANNRDIRKGDQRFSETWNTPTEPQANDLASGGSLDGGISIYYYKGAGGSLAYPAADEWEITCALTYAYRGKKAQLGTVDAN